MSPIFQILLIFYLEIQTINALLTLFKCKNKQLINLIGWV